MNSTLRTTLIAAVASAVTSVLTLGIALPLLAQEGSPSDREASNQAPVVSGEAATVMDVVENAEPAVVSVIISKDLPIIERYYDESPYFGLQIPRFRQSGTQRQEVGGGTAFFISADGLLMTNKHVVDDENASYTVLLNDGRQLEAQVLSRDPGNDIALLKVAGKDFPFISVSKREEVELGEPVIAIGNALAEYRNTVSVGVISGLSRSIMAGSPSGGQVEQLNHIIQTDAAINSGNSGGPLLDLNGDVIGMNTAVAAAASNIGFAIPASDLRRALLSYEEHGRIVRPYIGVRYVAITLAIQEAYKLTVNEGVLVSSGNPEEPAIVPGSPAEKAGLRANDIIVRIDEEALTERTSLAEIVQQKMPGDTISLRILRDGREQTVEVRLDEWKE